MSPHLEEVSVGERIPTLRVRIDATQMFLFSAATYNAHRIHYDRDWARDVEGYDDVLVQGPLLAAVLARAVTDWVGSSGRLVSYTVQNRAVAHPGQDLTFDGTVTAVRAADGLVDLDVVARHGEEVLCPGSATVWLPSRGER